MTPLSKRLLASAVDMHPRPASRLVRVVVAVVLASVGGLVVERCCAEVPSWRL